MIIMTVLLIIILIILLIMTLIMLIKVLTGALKKSSTNYKRGVELPISSRLQAFLKYCC